MSERLPGSSRRAGLAVPLFSRLSAWLFLGALLSGCTVWNRIDVCDPDRTNAPAELVNRRYEGSQRVRSPYALGALPSGGAYLPFSATAGTDQKSVQVWGTPLASDGSPLRDCDNSLDSERLLAGSDPTMSGIQYRTLAAMAPPLGADRQGLITYISGTGTTVAGTDTVNPVGQVWAIFISATGCFTRGTPPGAPFLIDTTGADETTNGSAAAIALGAAASGSHDDFLVGWIATKIVTGIPAARLRARVVRDSGQPEFLATSLSATGDAVDVPLPDRWLSTAALARLGPNRTAIVWHALGDVVNTLKLAILDDYLAPVAGPYVLASDSDLGAPLQNKAIVAAYDGNQLLVVWVQGDSFGAPRLFGRFFTADGVPLARPLSPDGLPFRLTTTTLGNEIEPAITTLDAGGFIVAWREEGAFRPAPADADQGGIRALAIGADGDRLFANRACDRTDFAVNLTTDGDQNTPSLTRLTNGDIMAAWTDASANPIDRDGDHVTSTVLGPGALFSGERLPPPPDPGTGLLPPLDRGRTCGVPGAAPDGLGCRCDADCQTGAICVDENSQGQPGGFCFRQCTATNPCGAGAICDPTSRAPICEATCAGPADCPPGRVCSAGTCFPTCAADSDCLSGHCDRDTALCSDGTPQAGAGLWQSCVRPEDCASGLCDASRRRCFSNCQVSRPNHCPPSAVCVQINDGDDLGLCLFPCDPNIRTCPVAGLHCAYVQPTLVSACTP